MSIIRIRDDFGPYCMSSDQGAALYDRLRDALQSKTPIEMDFSDVSVLIASFLNSSLAKLYGDFTQQEISSLISFRGLTAAHAEVIQAVVDNAKRYYYDEVYRKAQEDAVKKMFD